MKIYRILSTTLCLMALCATRVALSDMTPEERYAHEHSVVRGKLDEMAAQQKGITRKPSTASAPAKDTYQEVIQEVSPTQDVYTEEEKPVALPIETTTGKDIQRAVTELPNEAPKKVEPIIEPKKEAPQKIEPAVKQEKPTIEPKKEAPQKEEPKNAIALTPVDSTLKQLDKFLVAYKKATKNPDMQHNLLVNIYDIYDVLIGLEGAIKARLDLNALLFANKVNNLPEHEFSKLEYVAFMAAITKALADYSKKLPIGSYAQPDKDIALLITNETKRTNKMTADLGLVTAALELGFIKDGAVVPPAPNVINVYLPNVIENAKEVLKKAIMIYAELKLDITPGATDKEKITTLTKARTRQAQIIMAQKMFLEKILGKQKTDAFYNDIISKLKLDAESAKLLGTEASTTWSTTKKVGAVLGTAAVVAGAYYAKDAVNWSALWSSFSGLFNKYLGTTPNVKGSLEDGFDPYLQPFRDAGPGVKEISNEFAGTTAELADELARQEFLHSVGQDSLSTFSAETAAESAAQLDEEAAAKYNEALQKYYSKIGQEGVSSDSARTAAEVADQMDEATREARQAYDSAIGGPGIKSVSRKHAAKTDLEVDAQRREEAEQAFREYTGGEIMPGAGVRALSQESARESARQLAEQVAQETARVNTAISKGLESLDISTGEYDLFGIPW